jgi:glycosyltransferase involved in cell wall biosynthesis
MTPMRRRRDVTMPSSPNQPARDGTQRGLSLVLPAWNEEAVIEDTVQRCIGTLAEVAPDHEIIVVDDGSRDHTGEIAEQLAARHSQVHVIHNRPQRGYGGALLAGFAVARKPLVFFMDADGQFSIEDITLLLPFSNQGYRAVLGYRQHRQDPRVRLAMAWGWNTLVSAMFGLRIRDVDCAFKVYDLELLRALDLRAQGAMINTEMLVKLADLDVEYVEVPVRHLPRLHGEATGGNPRVILRAFTELLALRRDVRRWRTTLPVELTGTSGRLARRSPASSEGVLRGHASYPARTVHDPDAAA